MNDTETHLPANDSGVESQVAALQRQVFLQLLALIVIAATVVFYLYYQSRVVSSEYSIGRPRAMDLINLYNRNALAIENLNTQFINYGTTHPSFQPILAKYGLIQPPATTPKP